MAGMAQKVVKLGWQSKVFSELCFIMQDSLPLARNGAHKVAVSIFSASQHVMNRFAD